jgi:toxin ParE1/3/4
VTLRWTLTAEEQLERIYFYIARDKPGAAMQAITRIWNAAEMISQHPTMGKPGRGGNEMREFVKTPFVLVYSVIDDVVTIESVFHGNQRW